MLLTKITYNSRVFCYNKGDFPMLAFSWLELMENLI